MLLGAIAQREASLHGVELVPSLDLRRGQRHDARRGGRSPERGPGCPGDERR